MNTLSNMRDLASGEGMVGIIATATIVVWRMYRLPLLQKYVPEKVRWNNLSKAVQWSLTVGGAALGGVLTALSTGKSGWQLVGAALRAIKDVLLS